MAINSMICTLASNPFFKATKGSSNICFMRFTDENGNALNMTSFVPRTGRPHPWGKFRAGERVAVQYYEDTVNGKPVNRVRDIALCSESNESNESNEPDHDVQMAIAGSGEADTPVGEGTIESVAVRAYIRTLRSGKQVHVRGHVRHVLAKA